ncbi:acyl carrier protein [Piscinibacter defluvii]|uniref:acyl carrier protein n=1 Tax=Piscinibacter defluvii TaxID=1796922 RepID=UPI000FDDD5A6|nr:acyl carrier protein [Piscinibacter defluvii]
MTHDEIRAGVMATLLAIAPELAGEPLANDRALREQVDLDSMDWLNVIVGLHQRFGVDIPEADYARLTTLDAIVAYLAGRLAPGPA